VPHAVLGREPNRRPDPAGWLGSRAPRKETARNAPVISLAVASGWESTAVEQSLVVGHEEVRLRRMPRAVPMWIASRDRTVTGRTARSLDDECGRADRCRSCRSGPGRDAGMSFVRRGACPIQHAVVADVSLTFFL